MGPLCINKTCDSFYNHIFVFRCDPNCNCFTLLVAYIFDPLVDSDFTVIALLHFAPCPTGQLLPLFIGEEYIWVANVRTINEFSIYAYSSEAPAMNTGIAFITASRSPSTTSTSETSSYIHSIDTTPAANTARLGVNTECLIA